MSDDTAGRNPQRAFWVVATFYLLVAFEFFYMASPFALYFYAVYRPGLDLISANSALSWLSFFFLPHIVVETSSALIDHHNHVGAVIFLVGLLCFGIGAAQVYYNKLTRKGAVAGGVYRYIRHPQYVSLAVSSFGLLLLWPRYLALVLFLAVLFGYYFMARAEEAECEVKFGDSYKEYRKRTHMFLPFGLPLSDRLPGLPGSGWKRILSVASVFVLAAAVAIGLASWIRGWAVDSLYTLFTADSAYISLGEIDGSKFRAIVETAGRAKEVRSRLDRSTTDEARYFINYVLPVEWYVSEIPMNPVKGAKGHHSPASADENRYKIVYTLARPIAGHAANGRDLLLNTVARTPVMEVSLDLMGREDLRIDEPPDTARYAGIPVPIF